METKLKKFTDVQFRRKTGVRRNTFKKMVSIVEEVEKERKKISGRPMKLDYGDQVLMTLEYLREYRTYFSLGQSYDLSEANTYKIVRKVENILIGSKEFRLPNRKATVEDMGIEAIVVDAVESSIERPKKNKENTIQGRKRSIR